MVQFHPVMYHFDLNQRNLQVIYMCAWLVAAASKDRRLQFDKENNVLTKTNFKEKQSQIFFCIRSRK